MSTHRFDLSCYKYLREKMYIFHFNMYPFSFNFRGNNFLLLLMPLQKKNEIIAQNMHFSDSYL